MKPHRCSNFVVRRRFKHFKKSGTICVIAMLFSAPLFTTSLSATSLTWQGSGTDANWSTIANWGGSGPANGDTLIFSGATRPANVNDLLTLTSIGPVTFSNGGFNVSGNSLTLNGDFTNSGTNTWAINSTLGAARTLTSTSGLLTFNGSLTNASYRLTIAGAGDTTLSGIVGSGSGGILKSGAGNLTLSNVNTYSGSTAITGGTVSITSDSNLGTAPLVATPSNIVIDSGILSTTGTFILNANRGIAIGPTSGVGDGTINVVSGVLTYNGNITSNTGSSTGNLVKTGAGTLSLGGANSNTGNTTVSAGILKMGSTSAIPSGLSKGDLVLNATLDLTISTARSMDSPAPVPGWSPIHSRRCFLRRRQQ